MIEWNCPCGNSYKFHGFTKTEAQEPVVWRFYDGKMWCYVNHLTDLPQSKFEPLYTTPPQRTWVGLTDEDIDECFSRDPRVAARNAEFQLKEKNT